MKGFGLWFSFILLFSKTIVAQCPPFAATNVAGFCPPASSFPCVIRGEPFSEVIRFENWDSVGGIVISEFRVDSITNLPNGISYSCYPDNSFPSGAIGCIILTGMTNDSVAQDTMRIYVKVSLLGLGSFSGEIGEICEGFNGYTTLDSSDSRLCTFGYYYLRIINPGDTCTIDSICPQLNAGIKETVEGSSINPNPASENINVMISHHLNDFDFHVMDFSGRRIKSLNGLSGDRVNLNLKDIENGIYFYQIISNNYLVSRGKFVIIK